jgi:hypothetical protein
MKFSVESCAESLIEALPLIEEAWTAIGCCEFMLDPDIEDAIGNGTVKTFAARHGEELVGYALVVVSPNPLQFRKIEGMVLGIYVKPEHRAGGVATEFNRFIEARLCDDGVHCLSHTAPAGTSINRWLQRMGYSEVETVYQKSLQEH